MGYFLRKDNKKKGAYLQMYETYWDKDLKQPRSKCIRSFGYVDELKSDAIPDPVAYYSEIPFRSSAYPATECGAAERGGKVAA